MRWKVSSAITLVLCLSLCSFSQTDANPSSQPSANSNPSATVSSAVPQAGAPAATEVQRQKARAEAERILSAREFRRVQKPGLKESLLDQITRKLLNFFVSLLGHAPDLRVLSNIIVWGIVLLALAALFLWVWRMTRRALDHPVPLNVGVVEHYTDIPWREWMRMARAASERGAYRDAVHFAYWAGVASLEQRGAWKPDRARTPREYLGLVPTDHYNSLKALTRELERIWYARHDATAVDFQNCLAQLERMGCQ